MNVEIGSEAAQFSFLGIHKSDFRYSAPAAIAGGAWDLELHM
jgi:hypothetical protein